MPDRLTITVGPAEADITGTTNQALQAAVDRAAEGSGGVVQVLPGTYEMHDSLHLRSGVAVRGAGAETVLRKMPSVQSALSADLGYGHFDVSLAEPDRFCIGMGVHIQDDTAPGFYGTVATLTWRGGDRFGISRMLNHDYGRARNAVVTSVYPAISGYHLSGAAVENLMIDGNKGENAYLNGCRGGGIFLLQAHDVALRGLVVKNYNGDGISFQQCLRTQIEGCLLEGNAGHGLHPGSGSVAPAILGCRCVGNGADGIFYCLRVSYSLCEGCEITGNGHDGISIGGRDTHHIVRGNRITGNGRHAVYFRPADTAMGAHYNLIEGNGISANCASEGDAEIMIEGETLHVHVMGNRFGSGGRASTAVRVGERCKEIVIVGNGACSGFARAVDARCPQEAISTTMPAEPLPVGPENVPPAGMLHLGAA